MIAFNILGFFFVCILVLYIVYQFDDIMQMVGFEQSKIRVAGLDGYYYDQINLSHLSKPKIFIHLPIEKNSRVWESFGSRSSINMNISIAYICVKSIIETCGSKYDVILFDNNNVYDILQTYGVNDEITSYDPNMLNNEQLQLWQDYAKAKILYEFGGTMMSPYFYFRQCPSREFLQSRKFRVTYYANEGLKNTNERFVASEKHYMVSGKHNSDLQLYLVYLKEIFENFNKYESQQYEKVYKHLEKLDNISPQLIATQNLDGNEIFYDDWLSANKDLKIDPAHFGIYINVDMLKRNSKNAWFIKQSEEQVRNSHNNLAFYLQKYE